MRAAVITKQAPRGEAPSVIQTVDDWPDPGAPGVGEASIRTITSALNHMDLWVPVGIPGLELTYPRISGCDACGVVEAVGPGVEQSWVGRRVILNAAIRQPDRVSPDDPPNSTLAPAYHLIGEHMNGVHCERFNAPVANLQDVGDADPAEAAAFGLVALTAYGMFCKSDVRSGQSVLITGIGGGVSTSLLALCRWKGCRVCVTSRHEWKLDKARELGADHAILDKGEDWSKDVRVWTNKRGVDVVFDSVGKAVHQACIAALARGGRFVTCGATSGPIAETHLGRVFWNQLKLMGSTMGSNDEFAEVVSLFRAGKVRPVVDSTHAWSEAHAAWRRLNDSDQFGKIVLQWA